MSEDQPGRSRATSPQKKRLRRMARKAAAAEGHDWKSLSKEDRKTYKAAARQSTKGGKARHRRAGRQGFPH